MQLPPSPPYLLQTDQIDCYSQDGLRIPCHASGQDASFGKKSPPLPGPRFQVLDQLVRDTLTGAIWSKDANPAEFPLDWHEARAYAADMRARRVGGYDGWRLPSRRLLFTLVSHQHINPALPDDHPFENVFHGYYWTGESCRRLENQAWYVHLGGGRVQKGMKHGAYLVWPVSMPEAGSMGAAVPGAARFTIQGTCVRDAQTGLMWSMDADPATGPLSWPQALAVVETFNQKGRAGFRDWRLPNIRELESLVSLDAHSPALPAGHPFVHIRDAYWSSTTSVYEPRYAWSLYTQDGIVGVAFKTHVDFYLWPVRRELP